MGCDIHSVAEKQVGGKWQEIAGLHPFDWRSYSMFGFLANVRNYSAVTPISDPRGMPEDSPSYQDYDIDYHSHSWLLLKELAAFDYDQPVEDRRVMINGNGGCTAEPGGGKMTTYREFLGEGFFDDLAKLQEAGADRVVFWFDC